VRFAPSSAVAYQWKHYSHQHWCNPAGHVPLIGTGINTASTISTTWNATSITTTSATSGYTTAAQKTAMLLIPGEFAGTPPVAPTIADSRSIDGAGNGTSVTSSMTGLSPNTTYYVRAYAENASSVVYSTTTRSFTTLKGSTHKLIQHHLLVVRLHTIHLFSHGPLLSAGAMAPDGYLISLEQLPALLSVQVPNDFADYTVNSQYVSGGSTATATSSGLTPTTNYYFKIFPYTNDAALSKNYKVDATPQQSDCLR
jgi:hypothetical protein